MKRTPSVEPDGRALRETRQRRDQQALHAEGRPVPLRVLEQLVRLGDPDGLAPALEPVVEDDAGRLAALAGAGAVAEHEAAAEADGVRRIVGRGADEIAGLVHGPGPGEIFAMGLAGIDHRLELGVGQDAVGDDRGRQGRPVARLGRRHRGHGGRLHKLGRDAAGRPECGSTGAHRARRSTPTGDRPRAASSRWSHSRAARLSSWAMRRAGATDAARAR